MKRIILGAVLGVGVILGAACNSDSTRAVNGERGKAPVATKAPGQAPGQVAGREGPADGPAKATLVPDRTRPQVMTRPAGKGFDATLRLRGDNPNGISGLLLGVKDVRVFAGQQELPVSIPKDAVVDLANSGHAWGLGRFTVPPGIDAVRIELQVDDYGGFETAGRAGMVNARTAPISFVATLEDLALHGHAVVHMNVDQSLFDTGNGERLLLPKVTVRY